MVQWRNGESGQNNWWNNWRFRSRAIHSEVKPCECYSIYTPKHLQSLCYRMLQGAFLVYAIGVVCGVLSIIMEVRHIKGNLRKVAWKAVIHVKSIRGWAEWDLHIWQQKELKWRIWFNLQMRISHTVAYIWAHAKYHLVNVSQCDFNKINAFLTKMCTWALRGPKKQTQSTQRPGIQSARCDCDMKRNCGAGLVWWDEEVCREGML